MSSNLPSEIASTIQTAHIQRSPSPRHDLNPSTAASQKTPASLQRQHHHQHRYDSENDDDEIDEDEDGADIPLSVLKPTPRPGEAQGRQQRAPKHHFPPMPDLRFEQSYLHSISGAETWWKVAWVTVRDQMMMPLVQGVLYNLAICGWQHWNRNARLHGNTVGARARRWWYGVNRWVLPSPPPPPSDYSAVREGWARVSGSSSSSSSRVPTSMRRGAY